MEHVEATRTVFVSRTLSWRRRFLCLLTCALAGLPAAPGCAGYHIGNESLYPAGIQTVYVPVCKSNSFRRGFGEQLTEAIQKEIEKKTPFKVVGTPQADSTLLCTIVGEKKTVVARDIYNDPRELETKIQIQVQWLDRDQNLIRQMNPVPVPPDLVTISETQTLVPEVGQSVATAQLQTIQKLAKQIVGLMETPW